MKASLQTIEGFALLFALACAAPAAQPKSETPPPAVTLQNSEGSSVRVSAEIADDPLKRQQGLMHRASMDEMAGMLFLFPIEGKQSFWMKDTLIPLDMLFIRSDMTIAGIVENTEPLTLTGRGVDALTQYVLEVNGGFCARHAIRAGSRVRFDNVDLSKKR